MIAIKKVSPDKKWSFGESYDELNGGAGGGQQQRKGWLPVQSAMTLIEAGVAPLYVTAVVATTNV